MLTWLLKSHLQVNPYLCFAHKYFCHNGMPWVDFCSFLSHLKIVLTLDSPCAYGYDASSAMLGACVEQCGISPVLQSLAAPLHDDSHAQQRKHNYPYSPQHGIQPTGCCWFLFAEMNHLFFPFLRNHSCPGEHFCEKAVHKYTASLVGKLMLFVSFPPGRKILRVCFLQTLK